jgi:glycosyltransferase involved in cell wall biosynthesis
LLSKLSSIKFSVITVSRNSVETIERAIKSVGQQNWSNVEHIVIDGGSTDGTVEVLQNNCSKLSYMISEPDHGIYDAMNKGLLQASGDVICFLNSDDQYASADVLSEVALRMELHGLDALMGDVSYFEKSDPMRIVRRYQSSHFSPKRLAWGWMPAHPALFLRKHIFDSVGGFKINYRISGDFEFIVRAFNKSNLTYMHFPEVLVRMQVGGVSTGGWRSKILLNQEMLRACRENGIRTNLPMLLSRYPLKFLEMFKK